MRTLIDTCHTRQWIDQGPQLNPHIHHLERTLPSAPTASSLAPTGARPPAAGARALRKDPPDIPEMRRFTAFTGRCLALLELVSCLVVLIVTFGHVDVIASQQSRCCSRIAGVISSRDCCSGPRQRTLRTAKPEEQCAIPCGNVYRAVARGLRPGLLASVSGAVALPGPN